MDPVNVGVDLGSTALRVAYSAGVGAPVHTVATGTEGWGWLRAVPSKAAGIGVEFVATKSVLGAGRSDRSDARSARSLVTAALLAARKVVETETGRPVGHAVISVPARFSSSQRVGLRDAALEAGFPSVQLLTDSVAAVIAHNRQPRQAGTFLAYGVGYAGFELGLVRVVGSHYRSLGYEGGDASGGAALEGALLNTWVGTLQGLGELGDLRRFAEVTWLELRGIAQLVKEALGSNDSVTFPLAGQLGSWVRFSRAAFEEWLRPIVVGTADQVRRLLVDAEMTAADLDALVLFGGGTRFPLVREVIGAELSVPILVGSLNDIVVGAALRAAELGARPLAAGTEPDLGSGSVPEEPRNVAQEGTPVATVIAAVTPGSETSGPGRIGVTLTEGDAPLDAARQLVEAGDTEGAGALLRQLVDEAQAMLDALVARPAPSPSPSPAGHPRADKLLTRARQLLATGRYEDAVSESHIAWRNAPESVEVFDAMIDVHCDAAMADISVDRYQDADRWLRCAYGHDQSNARVRHLMAERTYLHAGQLSDLGRRREAVIAVNESLALDPDHGRAQQLQKILTRTRPAPPAGPPG